MNSIKFPDDSEFICFDRWDEALYQQALGWVGETRRVAFLSETPEKSAHPRIQIYVLETPLLFEPLVQQMAWSAVQLKATAIGDERFKEVFHRWHLAADLILSEAADYWVRPLKNARANDQPYRRGMDLKGAFEGIPALIVGAGPSLVKNRHLLKEFEEKALLFAGGSALNVIDTEPHFAASIDADAPHDQFQKHPFSHTPFCYQCRMNPENFSLVKGEKILFPDSSCEAINWICEEESFPGGWTVGNFLTAIAIYMGCSPIILVGMDLCYAEGRKYADLDAEKPPGLIQVGDIWTQRDWLMAAQWTEAVAAGRSFINATEGGMLRLPAKTLQAVLEELPKRGDLRKCVRETIQKLPLKRASRWEAWEGEIVEEKLLTPLWKIWRPIFERELGHQDLALHQQLFFQQVLQEHA